LFQTAAHSPFLFQNLTQSARLLLAFGMNLKQTNAVVMSSANALAYFGKTGADLENVSATFGKIYQSGYLMMRQVRQLVVAGIPVFPALRKELHLTDLQVQQFMAGKLKIPSDIGIQALLNYMNKNFGDGMQRFSKTWTGRWTTLKDYTQMLIGGLIQGPFNSMLARLGVINDAMAKLIETSKTKGFGATLQQLDSMLGAGGGLVGGINFLVMVFKSLWNILKLVFPVMWSMRYIFVAAFAPIYALAVIVLWLTQHALLPLKVILYPIVFVLLVRYVIWTTYAYIVTTTYKGAVLLLNIALSTYYWILGRLILVKRALARATVFLNLVERVGWRMAILNTTAGTRWNTAYKYLEAQTWRLITALRGLTLAEIIAGGWVVVIILAVLALYAAFAYFMVKSKAFRDFMLHYGGFIMLFLGPLAVVGTVLLIIGYFGKLKAAFFDLVNFVKSHWLDLLLFFATGGLGNILYHFWDPIKNGLSDAVNWMKGIFTDLFNWIKSQAQGALDPRNWIPFGLGSLVGGKGHVGFSWTDLIKLPFAGFWAEGGVTKQHGYAVVGERGPELVWLPGGANVRPLAPMPAAAGTQQLQAGGGPRQLTVHVPVMLDSGVLANSTAKLMLDQMARA
jgi:hypothetical protein